MHEENQEFDQAFEESMLDDLRGILSKLPKNTVTMLNMPKYTEAMRSVMQIIKFVRKDFPDAEVDLKFDEWTGTTLILTIVAEGMNIYAVKEFCEAISVASTMDVVPLDDGKIQIGFTYRKMKVAVPPSKDN